MHYRPTSTVTCALALAAACAASSSAAAQLVITEVMYDPFGGNEHEYVEIYNAGDAAVDLTGYLLGSGDFGMTELSGNLAAGETIVPVRVDGARAFANYTSAWGSDVNFFATDADPAATWPVYTNAGDAVTLYASFADLEADAFQSAQTEITTYERAVDVVDYSESGFPTPNDSASIYLLDVTADNSLGSNWALSVAGVDGAFQAAAPRSSDVGSPGFAAVAVPEPASLTALSAAALLLRRRR